MTQIFLADEVKTGFWVNSITYKVIAPNGRSQDIIIPGFNELERSYSDELLAWQIEETLEELREPPKVKHTKDQRQELGHILREIKRSHEHFRESLHGRYW